MIVEVEGWRDGVRVVSVRLRHGREPGAVLAARGFAVQAPLDARLQAIGPAAVPGSPERLVIRFRVERVPPRRPVRRPIGTDRHLLLEPGESPVPVQRVGGYAVVVAAPGLLATQHSAATNRAGTWGLPGGGLEPGEEPTVAVRRECWEETGQVVEVGDLVMVQTAHWIGRSPRGRAEDFHAIRLVYAGSCPNPQQPVVHDTAGTTAAAAWVPTAQLDTLRWSTPAREQLTGLGLLPARGVRTGEFSGSGAVPVQGFRAGPTPPPTR